MTHDQSFVSPSIRFKSIHIQNFKGIDELYFEFPEPLLEDDPNVLVFGSKNGVGKTSVFEACSLIYFMTLYGIEGRDKDNEKLAALCVRYDFSERFIQAGRDFAKIDAVINIDDIDIELDLELRRDGLEFIAKKDENDPHLIEKFPEMNLSQRVIERQFLSLFGIRPDPMILPRYIYFHSHRKVQEGPIKLGALVDNSLKETDGKVLSKNRDEPSYFKFEILRLLMSRMGLVENINTNEAETALKKMNELTKEFAGGVIERLRSTPDSSFEIRVSPETGGDTYDFDGLSSGQKEMISTLFLIWHSTKDAPGIVLIDEPELHLNAEWHRKFIRYLHKLAPQNQYIIATHSKEVFASVDPDRRRLIGKKGGRGHE